jgi:hypothetical protein
MNHKPLATTNATPRNIAKVDFFISPGGDTGKSGRGHVETQD